MIPRFTFHLELKIKDINDKCSKFVEKEEISNLDKNVKENLRAVENEIDGI